MVNTLPWPDSD